jgi:hypothetical protein
MRVLIPNIGSTWFKYRLRELPENDMPCDPVASNPFCPARVTVDAYLAPIVNTVDVRR